MFFKKKVTPPPVVQKYSEKFKEVKGRSLKDALLVAINALEKDIFPYDWTKQSSCNCGIMVQCILNTNKAAVENLFYEARATVTTKYEMNKEKLNRTWREVAQRSCSVTGKPLRDVFIILSNNGFLPEDIVHLEFMNNPAILEVSFLQLLYSD